MNNTTLGLIAAAVPLLLIGFIALRRLPWIFAFFVALVAVGLGYLDTTGAIKDFGKEVRAVLPEGLIPEHKHEKKSEPAADTTMAPAPGTTMSPAPTPPAEPPAAAPAEPPPAPAPEATPAPAPAQPTPAPANP